MKQHMDVDTIERCASVCEYLAVSLPELERSDLLNESVAYAHYLILASVSQDLRAMVTDSTQGEFEAG